MAGSFRGRVDFTPRFGEASYREYIRQGRGARRGHPAPGQDPRGHPQGARGRGHLRADRDHPPPGRRKPAPGGRGLPPPSRRDPRRPHRRPGRGGGARLQLLLAAGQHRRGSPPRAPPPREPAQGFQAAGLHAAGPLRRRAGTRHHSRRGHGHDLPGAGHPRAHRPPHGSATPQHARPAARHRRLAGKARRHGPPGGRARRGRGRAAPAGGHTLADADAARGEAGREGRDRERARLLRLHLHRRAPAHPRRDRGFRGAAPGRRAGRGAHGHVHRQLGGRGSRRQSLRDRGNARARLPPPGRDRLRPLFRAGARARRGASHLRAAGESDARDGCTCGPVRRPVAVSQGRAVPEGAHRHLREARGDRRRAGPEARAPHRREPGRALRQRCRLRRRSRRYRREPARGQRGDARRRAAKAPAPRRALLRLAPGDGGPAPERGRARAGDRGAFSRGARGTRLPCAGRGGAAEAAEGRARHAAAAALALRRVFGADAGGARNRNPRGEGARRPRPRVDPAVRDLQDRERVGPPRGRGDAQGGGSRHPRREAGRAAAGGAALRDDRRPAARARDHGRVVCTSRGKVDGGLARRRPGGDARLLRQQQGRRLRHLQLGALQGGDGTGGGVSRRGRAAAFLPRPGRHRGPRRRAFLRGHPRATARQRAGRVAAHGAGRGDRGQVRQPRHRPDATSRRC